MIRYKVARNDWNKANCRPELIGKVFKTPPSYCAVTMFNGHDRYVAIVTWARERYGRQFILMDGSPSKALQVERAAWNKYIDSVESARCL